MLQSLRHALIFSCAGPPAAQFVAIDMQPGPDGMTQKAIGLAELLVARIGSGHRVSSRQANRRGTGAPVASQARGLRPRHRVRSETRDKRGQRRVRGAPRCRRRPCACAVRNRFEVLCAASAAARKRPACSAPGLGWNVRRRAEARQRHFADCGSIMPENASLVQSRFPPRRHLPAYADTGSSLLTSLAVHLFVFVRLVRLIDGSPRRRAGTDRIEMDNSV